MVEKKQVVAALYRGSSPAKHPYTAGVGIVEGMVEDTAAESNLVAAVHRASSEAGHTQKDYSPN